VSSVTVSTIALPHTWLPRALLHPGIVEVNIEEQSLGGFESDLEIQSDSSDVSDFVYPVYSPFEIPVRTTIFSTPPVTPPEQQQTPVKIASSLKSKKSSKSAPPLAGMSGSDAAIMKEFLQYRKEMDEKKEAKDKKKKESEEDFVTALASDVSNISTALFKSGPFLISIAVTALLIAAHDDSLSSGPISNFLDSAQTNALAVFIFRNPTRFFGFLFLIPTWVSAYPVKLAPVAVITFLMWSCFSPLAYEEYGIIALMGPFIVRGKHRIRFVLMAVLGVMYFYGYFASLTPTGRLSGPTTGNFFTPTTAPPGKK
jgi:hypothetical protein